MMQVGAIRNLMLCGRQDRDLGQSAPLLEVRIANNYYIIFFVLGKRTSLGVENSSCTRILRSVTSRRFVLYVVLVCVDELVELI